MKNQFDVRFNFPNTAYKAWLTLRKFNFELKLRNQEKKNRCWKLETLEFNKQVLKLNCHRWKNFRKLISGVGSLLETQKSFNKIASSQVSE